MPCVEDMLQEIVVQSSFSCSKTQLWDTVQKLQLHTLKISIHSQKKMPINASNDNFGWVLATELTDNVIFDTSNSGDDGWSRNKFARKVETKDDLAQFASRLTLFLK
jgi:hypothetical protein